MSAETEIYAFSSKLNQNLKFDLPWIHPNWGTVSITVKEIYYDNHIENIENGFKIQFLYVEHDDKIVEHEIKIEAGSYNLNEIFDIIEVNLQTANVLDVFFYLNKHTGRIEIVNNSKYIIEFSNIAQRFFKLEKYWILPEQMIKSNDMFEIIKSKKLYLVMKGLRTGIHSNLNFKGDEYEIIYKCMLDDNFRQRKVEIVTEPKKFYFSNFKLTDVEFKIIDEFGVEINIQNIDILFYFETTYIQ